MSNEPDLQPGRVMDADLQPFGHGRRRRCCTPCSVLANATAKLQAGRYPRSAPPTIESLEALEGAPWGSSKNG